MKSLIISFASVCLSLSFSVITFAGDKEDVQSTLDNIINAFGNKDSQTYFAAFAEGYNVFTTVSSPLRFDPVSWKGFVDSAWQLKFVSYHQQDNVIQIYDGSTAIVTGYYTFKTMPEGGELDTQNGRASIIMVKQSGKWLIVHMHFSLLF